MIEDYDISRRPNVIPWPPIVLGFTILVAILLSIFIPIRSYTETQLYPLSVPGFIMISVSVFIDIWALRTMFRNKTNIRPNQGADKLVTTGPFAFSRNPIYLANTMALLGIGLAFNQPWFIITGFIQAYFIHHIAILREETHLSMKFGDEWEDYKKSVPRWIFAL